MAQFRPSPGPMSVDSYAMHHPSSAPFNQPGMAMGSSPAPASQPSSNPPSQPGSQSMPFAPSPAASTHSNTSAPDSQQTTSQNPIPQQTAPPASRPTVEPTVEAAVAKCARFFKTLLHLSQSAQHQHSPGTSAAVRQLVRGVVFGSLDPQDFTVQLQQSLRSQAQPHLLPFLRKTLPSLRQALSNGTQTIEGIGTAEDYEQEMAAGGGQPLLPSKLEAGQTAGERDENQRPGSVQIVGQQPAVNGEQPTVVVVPQPDGTFVTSSLPPGAGQSQNAFQGSSGPDAAGGPGGDAAASVPIVGPDGTALTRPLVTDQLQYTLLDAQALAEKIHSAMPESETVDGEVIELISNAVELRLRNLLAHLAAVAEHRLEPLRLNQFYQQVDNPREQLRFMEEIERVAHDRRETLEREALLKMSKSKGKDKDTLDRAKQMQKADQEARLNNEANAAAMAAIGGSRLKRTWAESSNPFDHQVASGSNVQTHRPRIKRVTMRDLQFVLSTDPFAPNSQLRHRIAFTSLASESNVQL